MKRPNFQSGDGNWLDTLPTKTKQYCNRKHFSTKLKPIQASLKKNEGYVYRSLLDKIEPKYEITDLVRTANLQNTFSKGDTNKWSYNLYKITEFLSDTIPCYKIDSLPEI